MLMGIVFSSLENEICMIEDLSLSFLFASFTERCGAGLSVFVCLWKVHAVMIVGELVSGLVK